MGGAAEDGPVKRIDGAVTMDDGPVREFSTRGLFGDVHRPGLRGLGKYRHLVEQVLRGGARDDPARMRRRDRAAAGQRAVAVDATGAVLRGPEHVEVAEGDELARPGAPGLVPEWRPAGDGRGFERAPLDVGLLAVRTQEVAR